MIDSDALLATLTAANSSQEQERQLLDLSLSGMPSEMETVVMAAAVPHWFNFAILCRLFDEETADDYYDELLDLGFVKAIPGRGYTFHEAIRLLLLDRLWEEDRAQFGMWSGRMADYCQEKIEAETVEDETKTRLLVEARQDGVVVAEEVYHRLVSDPELGIARFQEMATAWANYEQSDFAAIERMVQVANEQIDHGRVAAASTPWVHLWQAKLGLIYDQPVVSEMALGRIGETAGLAPLLVAEIEQTYGDFYASQEEMGEAAVAWEQALAGYRQAGAMVEHYLVREKMKAHQLAVPEDEVAVDEAEERPRTEPSKLTLGLLDSIENAWINGVLNQVFQAEQEEFDLSLTSRRQVQQRGGAVRELPGQGRLSDLLAASGASLLILGAPGSGKTITLLQLLAELVEQARQDGNNPVPLLLNLSSFGRFEGGFVDWLVEQVHDQYGLARRLVRSELERSNRFVFLFDGLDEVPEETETGGRDHCVVEINRFQETQSCGVVVCSRIHDYRQLSEVLTVEQAVVIQPLSRKQVLAGLVGMPALQQVVAGEGALLEALRSPLLLTLFRQTFGGEGVEMPAAEQGAGWRAADWRREIFRRYVGLVLPAEEEGTEKKSPRRWLSFLSRNMQKAGTTLFQVEDLQPTWLPEERPWWQNYYGGWSSFAVGADCTG